MFAIYTLAFAGLVIFYLYSCHRLKSLNAIRKVVKVNMLTKQSHRCRTINATQFQCLPNVMFIGASKCGTTSITRYLREHPSIKFVNRRVDNADNHLEVHRFDRDTFALSIKAVELADEWASSPLLSSPNLPLIHYTPQYLYAPSVPFEVRDFYPQSQELKFIISLRDPIARSFSSYWFKNSQLSRGRGKDGVPVNQRPDRGLLL